MVKEEIYTTYAIKQGYECWWELLHYCIKNGNVQYHIDKVTDLIQEELKKKIAENKYPFTQEILNTEIL